MHIIFESVLNWLVVPSTSNFHSGGNLLGIKQLKNRRKSLCPGCIGNMPCGACRFGREFYRHAPAGLQVNEIGFGNAGIADAKLEVDFQFGGNATRQITHDYPVGSYVSSALVAGDLRAYVSHLFDQATWNGTFADALSGSAATATYNDVLAPIVVTNAGAITERWAIQFTNTTAFNVTRIRICQEGPTIVRIFPHCSESSFALK